MLKKYTLQSVILFVKFNYAAKRWLWGMETKNKALAISSLYLF